MHGREHAIGEKLILQILEIEEQKKLIEDKERRKNDREDKSSTSTGIHLQILVVTQALLID